MIVYIVKDKQNVKEEKSFLGGIFNRFTSFFTPSDESIIRDEVNTAISQYNLIYLYSRSFDYFNRSPFMAFAIPRLKKELNFSDSSIAEIIEYAIIISRLSAISLKSCIDAFLDDECYDKQSCSVLEDFFVSYYKIVNSDWNEFFAYKYETDVFKGIESMKTLKSRVPLHDYAYKQKIMKWARLEGIQPLLIDALPIYRKNVGKVSYEKLYFKLSKIKKYDPFDYLAENVEDLDAFCFGVAYLKFTTDLSISDEYLSKSVPDNYIDMYRVLWWQCELWKKLELDKTFQTYHDYRWLNDTSKGLNAYLEQLKRKLLLKGETAFSLTPEQHYLDVSCDVDSETLNTGQLLLDAENNKENKIEVLGNENADNLENTELPKSQESIKTLDLNKIFYDDITPAHYDRVILKLKEMTFGLKGKEFAIIIRAAYEAKILKITPSSDLLQKMGFSDFGARSNYMKQKSVPLQINPGITGDKEVVPYQLDIYNTLVEFKKEILSE